MYWIGLADCYGIESFIPEKEAKERLFLLKVRAMANRHRHAVVYRVEPSKEKAKKIEKLLKEGKYEEALHILKAIPDIEIMKERGMAKSWGLIPNKDLDPYTD